MADVDIEITDAPPDVSEYSYPLADGLLVEGMRVKKGDLIFSPGDEKLDDTWEIVYGFGWGGLHTDSLGVYQMPRYRKWSDFVNSVETGDLQMVFLREETSFYSEEEVVRTLSHYQYYHEEGMEFILVDRTRSPLETASEIQFLKIYESIREMVDSVYTPDAITTPEEAEAIYELLIDSGVREGLLTPPDDILNQAGLDKFTD